MSNKNDSIHTSMEANKTKVSKEMKHDAKFAVCEADRAMLQSQLSDLAQSTATSATVKSFSRTMEQDHEKMNRELKALAAKKNITVPDNLSARSQKTYRMLAKKKGARFDKAYMKCMKKTHKMQYASLKKESKKGKDADIRAWAAANAPSIEIHLNETKEACKRMKDEK
jgi:putative membrane protein